MNALGTGLLIALLVVPAAAEGATPKLEIVGADNEALSSTTDTQHWQATLIVEEW
jgi:hypothetical protein